MRKFVTKPKSITSQIVKYTTATVAFAITFSTAFSFMQLADQKNRYYWSKGYPWNKGLKAYYYIEDQLGRDSQEKTDEQYFSMRNFQDKYNK